MATRSPGIYYNEIDNTQYTNPEAISGTTLAVVGYATKGPEGVPVEINSWQKFLEIFGKPVKGMYSGLAVKNYLQAGGTVLFTRVFDEDLASPSSYTIKNGIPDSPAYIYFDHQGDVLQGQEGYNSGNIYSFKLEADGNSKSKNIIIRTEKYKKLSQASIIQQINDQIVKESPYMYEFKVNNEMNKYYIFKVNSKKYFFKSDPTENKENFANSLNNRLKYSNAFSKFTVSSGYESGSNLDNYNLTGEKKFKVNGKEYAITLDGKNDIKSIVEEINKNLSLTNIKAFVETNNLIKNIYFVNFGINVGTDTVKITCDDVENPLFMNGSENINTNFSSSTGSENTIFVKSSTEEVKEVEDKNITASYDINSNDIIIVHPNSQEIKIEDVKDFDKEVITSLFEKITSSFFYEGRVSLESLVSVEKDVEENRIKFISKTTKSVTLNESDIENSNYTTESMLSIMNVGNQSQYLPGILSSERDQVEIVSKEKGSGTKDISIEVYSISNPISDEIKKNIKVYSNGILKESFDDISLNRKDLENRIDTILKKDKENGGSSYMYMNIKEVPNSQYLDDIELPDGVYYLGQNNNRYDEDFKVGNDGVAESNLNTEEIFNNATNFSKSLLSNKDLYDFHIILAPDAFFLDSVQDNLIKLCETRGDAITIIDPPAGLDKEAVIDWHNGQKGRRKTALESNYAITYWPWCKVYDTSSGTGKFAWVMPSVVMAAQYVKNDINNGPQIAPAGELNGRLPVIDIQSYPSESDRDELYVNYNRINPVVKFKDGSVVAYGEKTTQRKESVLTKIHTRRMLVQIKKQCRGALRRYLFMPNTTDYLGKVSNDITSILEAYKANGGLNFYKVICDETNNTIETRQQDIINVDAILVPQGTIEQINISLTLNKSAETVSD